jgi:hypothetical protein
MFAAQTRSLGGSSCLVGCNRGYVRGISWVNQSTYNPAYGLLAKWDDPPKKDQHRLPSATMRQARLMTDSQLLCQSATPSNRPPVMTYSYRTRHALAQ